MKRIDDPELRDLIKKDLEILDTIEKGFDKVIGNLMNNLRDSVTHGDLHRNAAIMSKETKIRRDVRKFYETHGNKKSNFEKFKKKIKGLAEICEQRANSKKIKTGSGLRGFLRDFLYEYLSPYMNQRDFISSIEALFAGERSYFDFGVRYPSGIAPTLSENELSNDVALLRALETDEKYIEALIEALNNKSKYSFFSHFFPYYYWYLDDYYEDVSINLLFLEFALYLSLPPSLRYSKRGQILKHSAVGLTFAISGLTAIPVGIIFDCIYGTYVIEKVIPGLDKCIGVLKKELQTFESLSIEVGNVRGLLEELQNFWNKLLDMKQLQNGKLMNYAKKVSENRICLLEHESPKEISISFPIISEDHLKQTTILPNYKFQQETKEIYWLDKKKWEQLFAAILLISQSGIILNPEDSTGTNIFVVLVAACNRYGGKHPPHSTHNAGHEIDLDFGVTWGRKSYLLPDLRRMKKVLLPVCNPDGRKYYDYIPIAAGPLYQSGYNALVTWIVIQALLLTGYNRFLYGDLRNINESIKHLSMALPGIDAIIRPFESKKYKSVYGEALFEPKDHYNHIHAESYRDPPFNDPESPVRLDEDTLRRLYELALQRDQDPAFRQRFFPSFCGLPENVRLAEKLWELWKLRSDNGNPSLLPVWISERF